LFYLPVNALEALHHLGVDKPEDSQALVLEVGRPFRVVGLALRGEVRVAVYLDHKFGLGIVEVHRVADGETSVAAF
jgi:hypothetical protein